MTTARTFARRLTKFMENRSLEPNLRLYKDTKGLLTIGWGHCIERRGISEAAADFIFDEDYDEVAELLDPLPVFKKLDAVRQAVILDMGFNLGYAGLIRFRKMWRALDRDDYETAAKEMINSTWYRQVGLRSADLVGMMRTGDWPNNVGLD